MIVIGISLYQYIINYTLSQPIFKHQAARLLGRLFLFGQTKTVVWGVSAFLSVGTVCRILQLLPHQQNILSAEHIHR